MAKSRLLLSILLGAAIHDAAAAQAPPPTPSGPDAPRMATPATLTAVTYRLWPGRAPGAGSDSPEETPSLTVIRPQVSRSGAPAIVIAPGGGYVGLANALEGLEPANWFAARGVTAFILTYRVGATARLPIPLGDGARAMRFVRAHAAAFGIDPARIGMLGFSAGGHLAATVATEGKAGDPAATDIVERADSRPNYLVLGYPWLEGTQRRADGGSSYCDFAERLRTAKGGPACDPARFTGFDPIAHVDAKTPPSFLYHTTADALVPVQGSIRFYQRLVASGVPAELHVFEQGPHGTGFGGLSATLVTWPELLDGWLREHGWLGTP